MINCFAKFGGLIRVKRVPDPCSKQIPIRLRFVRSCLFSLLLIQTGMFKRVLEPANGQKEV
jgi:hypothetical protein